MSVFILSLLGAVVVSLISLVGVVVLIMSGEKTKKTLLFLVSFSAGGLLGGAFFHLLPESLAEFGNPTRIFQFVLLGMAFFFVLERILRWRHCHDVECATHKHLGYLNLFGDGMHNFLDGIIIVSAFSTSVNLGIAVLLSIILHEIPQEIGDFGVLIYAGFSRIKALIYNLISASLAVAGVFAGWFLVEAVAGVNNFLLPFAAGSFIYIAASDLIPELHKEPNIKKSFFSFVVFALAIIFMFLIT